MGKEGEIKLSATECKGRNLHFTFTTCLLLGASESMRIVVLIEFVSLLTVTVLD